MTARRVLIFGCQELGLAVARRLRKTDCEFLLIDQPDALQHAVNEGFTVSSIDYTRDGELASVGIGHGVDLVFCLLDDDAQNVFLTIAIRALGPNITIIATAKATDTLMKLRAAGANQVIDPQDIVGNSIARCIQQPLATEAVSASLFSAKKGLEFREWAVTTTSPWIGHPLQVFADSVSDGTLILGISHGQRFIFYPECHEPLQAGDTILTLGPGMGDRDRGVKPARID
jgi:voltage-gated potassium channel